MLKRVLYFAFIFSLIPVIQGAFDKTDTGICNIRYYCPCGYVNVVGRFEYCSTGWGICFDGSPCDIDYAPECALLCGSGGSGGGGGGGGGGGAGGGISPCDPAHPTYPSGCEPWQY